MPILGTIASSYAQSAPNSFFSIASVTVTSGGASYIDFTSIPQTYKHLQLRGLAKDSRSDSASDNLVIQLNGVTSSNYTWASGPYFSVTMNTTTGSAGGQNLTSQAGLWVAYGCNTTSTSANNNNFGMSIIDFLDYTDTNWCKNLMVVAGHMGAQLNTNLGVSSNFNDTAAITSIRVKGQNGNFEQYTRFSLYGIEG